MHIGINAQLLSFSHNYRNGGISRYIRYLLTGLAQQPGQHTYTIFVNGPEVIEHLEAHPQFTYVPVAWPESQPAARVAWEQLMLPSLIRQRGIEVLHSPVNVLPRLLPRTCAGVITLHDLAFLRMPEVLTAPKRFYHQTFTLRSLRQATAVIANSESTRSDAIELAHVPMERVSTVYLCIEERFGAVIEEEDLQAFRERHGIAEGYLLYMGTLEPRKNIPTLLEAFARLRQQYAARVKLALVGSKGWLYEEIFTRVRQLGLEEEVLFPGYVSDAEQVLWYHAAEAFVYPSLYEGFGMPVTEALACGIPVVTSQVSSLPEAGAGLALTVDPHDPEAMAAALNRALTDLELRERCKASTQKILQRFSLRTMVEQTVAVYERAAAAQTTKRDTQALSSVH